MDYNLIEYKKNFISEKQELDIVKIIPKENRNKDKSIYKIYRFGKYTYPYNTDYVSDNIPSIFHELNIPFDFNSITINQFDKNHFIPYHYDSHFAGKEIYVLSLHGSSELSFINKNNEAISFLIEPRSLYVIKDDLRTNWKHSTTALENRISVVFRNSIDFKK